MDFKETLASILAKSPADLTADDVVFLKARRSYLTEEQVINFLGQPEVVESVEPAMDAEPKRKAKKSA